MQGSVETLVRSVDNGTKAHGKRHDALQLQVGSAQKSWAPAARLEELPDGFPARGRRQRRPREDRRHDSWSHCSR